jgi:hypothetical protein
LPVFQRPLQESFYGVALARIGKLFRNQQPSEAGDGVSRLAGCVGDGNAEIVGHILHRTGSRSADAREIRLHETACGILDGAVSNVVLRGIDELHVAHGIGSLLHQAGYTFAALAAEANGPVH